MPLRRGEVPRCEYERKSGRLQEPRPEGRGMDRVEISYAMKKARLKPKLSSLLPIRACA